MGQVGRRWFSPDIYSFPLCYLSYSIINYMNLKNPIEICNVLIIMHRIQPEISCVFRTDHWQIRMRSFAVGMCKVHRVKELVVNHLWFRSLWNLPEVCIAQAEAKQWVIILLWRLIFSGHLQTLRDLGDRSTNQTNAAMAMKTNQMVANIDFVCSSCDVVSASLVS